MTNCVHRKEALELAIRANTPHSLLIEVAKGICEYLHDVNGDEVIAAAQALADKINATRKEG